MARPPLQPGDVRGRWELVRFARLRNQLRVYEWRCVRCGDRQTCEIASIGGRGCQCSKDWISEGRQIGLTTAMSFSEIGRELGVTRERVRQIYAGAIEKLRAACTDLGITPEDFVQHLADRESPQHAMEAVEMEYSE